MQNPFLIGTNLYLRALEREDAHTFVPWMNDPEVRKYVFARGPFNLPTEEAFIAHAYGSEDRLVLGIVLRNEDRLIGATGLHLIDWRNRQAGFGITIGDKTQWGQGYGAEATRLVVGHAFEHPHWKRSPDGGGDLREPARLVGLPVDAGDEEILERWREQLG